MGTCAPGNTYVTFTHMAVIEVGINAQKLCDVPN